MRIVSTQGTIEVCESSHYRLNVASAKFLSLSSGEWIACRQHERVSQTANLCWSAKLNDQWRRGSWVWTPTNITFNKAVFGARCNIYILLLCHDASPSVCLSVCLSMHWRIIADLGFKFRSHFAAHCGRRAAGGRRAAHRAACGRIISRHASQC